MTDNPYAPPKAAVNEVVTEAPAIRPREVTRAVQLRWVGLAIGQVINIVGIVLHPGSGRPGLFVSVLVYVPLGLLIMWWFNGMILKGKNWARILQLLGVVGAPLTAYLVLASPVYASDRILPLVGLCASWPLYAWACWLVFTSPGKEWFRKRARRGGAASGE